MDVRTERSRTAGRLAPTGGATPNVHQTISGGGRRKAIPVPPPRVPTPMPTPNNNPQRNNVNDVAPLTMPTPRKEPHENIARIAKRYLDDNMQQAWINPRLISMINMEAVTSTDYNSENLSRNFNQVGFNTYNYSQFEEKYKPRENIKYGDEYEEYARNSTRNPSNPRNSSRHSQELGSGDKNARSRSQPERQHHSSYETRSKSQDSRELTFYQIDPPLKYENRHGKCHRSSFDKILGKGKEFTFYEIDGPPNFTDKSKDRDKDWSVASIYPKHNHGKQINQEQNIVHNYNRSQSDVTENFRKAQCNPYVEPPKYRQFDRPPRYQEDPPKAEPPPKYHQDPPKYSEVANRRQDDLKRAQEEKGRRQAGASRNGVGVGAAAHGTEAAANLASVTPTAREATRGGGVTTRQRQTHKQTSDSIDDDVETLKHSENSTKIYNYRCNNGVILGVTCPEVSDSCFSDYSKFKTEHPRSNDKTNSGLCVPNEFHGAGTKYIDKMKSVREDARMYHETGSKTTTAITTAATTITTSTTTMTTTTTTSTSTPTTTTTTTTNTTIGNNNNNNNNNNKSLLHEAATITHVGYKVENLKYYGELKGYDFKSYGTIDQPHEKSHQYASSDKGFHQNNHEKSHARSLQGYASSKVSQSGEKSFYSDKYGDHYYHRLSHVKPPNAFQVYQESKYSYNVSGVPGTPAQASAAAAFFAR